MNVSRYFLCAVGVVLAIPLPGIIAVTFTLPITNSGIGYLLDGVLTFGDPEEYSMAIEVRIVRVHIDETLLNTEKRYYISHGWQKSFRPGAARKQPGYLDQVQREDQNYLRKRKRN